MTLFGLNSFLEVLMNAGAIPGLDITPEAALAKLAHVLSLPIRLAPLVIFENILTFLNCLQSQRTKRIDGEEYARRDVSKDTTGLKKSQYSY